MRAEVFLPTGFWRGREDEPTTDDSRTDRGRMNVTRFFPSLQRMSKNPEVCMHHQRLPIIVQGGMGVGVSGWRLARAVSRAGQLGVVSGTAIDVIVARRLQLGDPGGHVRRALDCFPFRDVGQRILDRFFVPDGKPADRSFRSQPIPTEQPNPRREELLVAANFVEVFLAKEGHGGLVGINYLEKVQLPTLPSLYGAMLAGVDFVLIGAGIPATIPGILDEFAEGRRAELKLHVHGKDGGGDFVMRFDPRAWFGAKAPRLRRPRFIAIVSSATLATMLARKSTGEVDGFVVEGSTAGGHNAPPRGPMRLSGNGEPIYGVRDIPDLPAMRALGRPFWLAGSCAEPQHLLAAIRAGAAGVQVGTAFAYCEESGLDPDLKRRVLEASQDHDSAVFTDPVASPTGFPFKVVQLKGTMSDDTDYEQRARTCDLGFLRQAFKKANGELGWRCSAEPVADYVAKGGAEADTCGRKCLCNALMASIGLGQIQRHGEREKPLVTSGNDVTTIARFLRPGADSYSALRVIECLLDNIDAAQAVTTYPARHATAGKSLERA
jgi:NAD(P)H-dependent flavin oxidoreductase YrpB (nitropropane dioxygenase family)